MPFIIALLAVVVMAAGFIILHVALTHKTAELRVAGWVLVIGGGLTIAGMFYYPSLLANPQAVSSPVMQGWRKSCHGGERGEKYMQMPLNEEKPEEKGTMPPKKMKLQAPPPPATGDIPAEKL